LTSPSHSPDESYLLKVEGIEKQYGRLRAIRIGSFVLRMGDFVGISGPNGAGKSTFIRILAGVTVPSRGRVRRSEEMCKMLVAYVPEVGSLYSNLTVLENMELCARLYGRRLDPDSLREWYVEELGLTGFLRRRVSTLSFGYQKMASLACRLCVGPHGLLLDEPLSGLDADRASIVSARLAAMQMSLRFLVVSSHEEPTFLGLTRTVELAEGEMVC
jgi:ABC-2 type transport system ATP-binding protein